MGTTIKDRLQIELNTVGDGQVSQRLGRVSQSVRGLENRLTNTNALMRTLPFAAVTAGAAVMAARTLEVGDQIQKLNLRLGVSTAALSQYRFVTDQTGVSFSTFTTGLQRMTRRVAEAAQGQGEAKDALRELGLEADVLAQLAPEDQFESIADAMAQVSDQGDRVRLAMKLFDTDGVALLQTMQGGSTAIRQLRDDADQLGITLQQSQADQIAAFNDRINKMQTRIEGAAQSMTTAMIPSLNKMLDAISGAPRDIDALADALDRLQTTGLRGRNNTGTRSAIADIQAEIQRALAGAGGSEGIRTQIAAMDATISDLNDQAVRLDAALAAYSGERVTRTGSGRNARQTAYGALVEDQQDINAQLREVTAQREQLFTKLEEIELNIQGGPLPDTPRKTPAAGGAKQTLDDGAALLDQLQRQAALYGEVSDVARVRYEIEQGALTQLGPARQAELLQAAGVLDGLREQTQEAEKLKQRLDQMRVDAQGIRDAINPFANAERDADRANALFGRGLISEQELNEYLLGFDQIEQRGVDAFSGIEQASQSWSRSFADALVKGEQDFSQFALSIMQQIASMLVQQGSSELFGFIAQAAGSAFGGGDAAPLEARAGGGSVFGGRAHLVGEMGPELFIPNQSGTVIANHELGGPSASITQNITINGGSGLNQAQLMQFKEQIKAETVQAVGAEIGRGGRLSRAAGVR